MRNKLLSCHHSQLQKLNKLINFNHKFKKLKIKNQIISKNLNQKNKNAKTMKKRLVLLRKSMNWKGLLKNRKLRIKKKK